MSTTHTTPGLSVGRKYGIVPLFLTAALAIMLFLLAVLFIFLSVNPFDPEYVVVYKVIGKSKSKKTITLETVQFENPAVKYEEDIKVLPIDRFDEISQEGLKELEVGDFCYFFRGGNRDSLQVESTRDRHLAELYAQGIPNAGPPANWKDEDFLEWIEDPADYKRKRGIP